MIIVLLSGGSNNAVKRNGYQR